MLKLGIGKCKLCLQAPQHLCATAQHQALLFEIADGHECFENWHLRTGQQRTEHSFVCHNLTCPQENQDFVGQRIVTSFPALTKRYFDSLADEDACTFLRVELAACAGKGLREDAHQGGRQWQRWILLNCGFTNTFRKAPDLMEEASARKAMPGEGNTT